eukprot:g7325.t1
MTVADRSTGWQHGRRYGSTMTTNPTENDALLADRHAATYVRMEGVGGRRRTTMKWLGVAAIAGVLAVAGLKTRNVAGKGGEDTTAVLQAEDNSQDSYLAKAESIGKDRIVNGLLDIGGTFDVVATNDYGEFDRRALALYELDMIIEPHKNTTITAVSTDDSLPHHAPNGTIFYWYLHKADDSGALLEDFPPEVSEFGTRTNTVTLREAGQNYWLWVVRINDDFPETGVMYIAAEALKFVSCRYVRREARDLSPQDSEKYFTAMRRLNTISLEDGRSMYGSTFANAKIIAAHHASQKFCFYGGLQYHISHAAMSLWVERSLQMIDPTVSLVHWDFTRDTAELGANWADSAIFSPQMFGPAKGNASEHYRLGEGWFRGLTSLYDPREKFVHEKIDPSHNAWGFIDSKYSYERSGDVTRTASYCEMDSELEFSTCNVVRACFEDNNSVDAWSTCIENGVLQATQSMIGGAYDCSTSMEAFRVEHPEYTRGLLSFAVGYIVTETWPTNSLMDEYNVCDEHCTVGAEKNQTCGCTCMDDPFEWSDEVVFTMMRPTMEAMSEYAHGDQYVFIDKNETLGGELEAGFMQDGVRLDTNSTLSLLRQLLVIACEPGALGSMAGAAAPADPIFFALHPTIEKALHILALSPSYEDYEWAWVDHDCGHGVSGGGLEDALPFTERYLGAGRSSEFLTNEDIWRIVNPHNRSLPYLYDKFETWGTCSNWFDV